MQYNKQRGRDVVRFAPCAIVEKPHEGFWVLKDKPWLAGREAVMQQNCVFHPFFLSFIFSQSLFFYPSFQVLSFTKFSLLFSLCPLFFSFFISFILWHIRLSCNTLQLKMLRPLECSVKEVGGPRGRDRPA